MDVSAFARELAPDSFESRLSSTKELGKQPTHCSSDLKKGSD